MHFPIFLALLWYWNRPWKQHYQPTPYQHHQPTTILAKIRWPYHVRNNMTTIITKSNNILNQRQRHFQQSTQLILHQMSKTILYQCLSLAPDRTRGQGLTTLQIPTGGFLSVLSCPVNSATKLLDPWSHIFTGELLMMMF